MRVTSKGQVTIPKEIRERFGFLPGSEMEFQVEGNAVRLVKASDNLGKRGRAASAVARLRGSTSTKMSTGEILALTRRP